MIYICHYFIENSLNNDNNIYCKFLYTIKEINLITIIIKIIKFQY